MCSAPGRHLPPPGGGFRLRSAPQACGAAARVLPGARPAPRLSDPPVSLPSTTVAAVVFAPLRKHAAPPPGLYPARGPLPRRLTPRAPWARLGPLDPPHPFSASLFVRAGRRGPPLRLSAVTTSRGTCAPPPLRGGGAVLAPLSPLYKGWRRRRGPTRRAAHASPLRLSGPVGPARIPCLPPLDHGGGGRLRSAPQACGAAAGALPGARPAPRLSDPPVSLPSTTVAAVVFAPLRKHAAPPPGLYPARGPLPRRFTPRAPWARLGPLDPPHPFSASLFVRAGRRGPPLRLSAVTTSRGTCAPPPRRGGGAVLAPLSPLYKGRRRRRGPTRRAARAPAAPPLGPRGPGSDSSSRSPSPRPRWRRSSSLRPASMWRRLRGSTRRAARAPVASLLGPSGPGSDPSILPTNLRVALRARGPAGPAVTPPSSGRNHLRGGRVLRPPLVGAVLARLHRGWRPAGPLCYGRRRPATFICSCRSAHCGRTLSITACPKCGPKTGSVSIRPCTPTVAAIYSPG